jgi:hypothetical protein
VILDQQLADRASKSKYPDSERFERFLELEDKAEVELWLVDLVSDSIVVESL